MIKIKNLTKEFYSKTVLEEVNLEIQEGKFTTLLGENGSGKSTLLNILSGYELPTDGQVTYKDVPLRKLDFDFKHDIFFVHEKINYFLPVSMNEYISILRGEIPNWNEELFQKMVKDRKIDLNNNFQNFSRGQKMQIALMIGLASNPKLLLLDEITSVIDVYGRKYFLDLLKDYVNAGNTVVITTNIINELEFYTDNIIVIKNGGIALNKSVDEIPNQFVKLRNSAQPDHPIFEKECCVWAGVNSDKSVSYIIPNEEFKKENVPEELMDKRKSTLEDVFIYYFNQDDALEVENENAA